MDHGAKQKQSSGITEQVVSLTTFALCVKIIIIKKSKSLTSCVFIKQ